LFFSVLNNHLHHIKKKTYCFLFPVPFFHSVPPVPYLFHPSLPSSFSILSVPFSPPFSFRYIHSTCVQLSLSPHHILHLLRSVQYLFSLSSFLHLNLAIIFLSLALSLPRSPVTCHTSCCGWIFRLSPFFVACLCFCPFHSALYASISFLFLIFPLLHWHTRFSCFFSFLFSIPLVSDTLPFHPFFIQTLPLSLPLSLLTYSSYTLSSLCNLAFLCPLVAPRSNIFLVLSLYLLFLVPSILRPLPCTSIYSLSCSQTSSFSS
jgi:hypothetical protein